MPKVKLIAGLFAIAILFLIGCKKDKAPGTAVFVSTVQITNITSVSATGGGDVDVVGAEAMSERGLCWATNSKPTVSDNKIAVATGKGPFTAEITGLTAGNTYYV